MRSNQNVHVLAVLVILGKKLACYVGYILISIVTTLDGGAREDPLSATGLGQAEALCLSPPVAADTPPISPTHLAPTGDKSLREEHASEVNQRPGNKLEEEEESPPAEIRPEGQISNLEKAEHKLTPAEVPRLDQTASVTAMETEASIHVGIAEVRWETPPTKPAEAARTEPAGPPMVTPTTSTTEEVAEGERTLDARGYCV